MNLITGTQIKLGRTILNWSMADLAERSGFGTTTVKKLEHAGENYPAARVVTVVQIRETLEAELRASGWHFTESGGVDKLASTNLT